MAEGLVRHIKLAKNYLRHAVDEINSLKGNQIGRIMVGSLPFARSIILPRAITSLLAEHPNINVSTTESPYDDLISGLRCGDVDFLIGALRNEGLDGLVEEPILEDHLSIIVRKGPSAREEAQT